MSREVVVGAMSSAERGSNERPAAGEVATMRMPHAATAAGEVSVFNIGVISRSQVASDSEDGQEKCSHVADSPA